MRRNFTQSRSQKLSNSPGVSHGLRRVFTTKKPPLAKQLPSVKTHHGHKRHDPFAWIQDSKDPAVSRYVKAENDYANELLKPTQKLSRKLYEEIKGRIKETDMSVPVEDGPFIYYTRVVKGKQYPIHCRKRKVPLSKEKKAKEEIVLDENVLAEGKKFFSLGAYEVSPDHTLLAYAVDTTGDENHTLYIKNLETGDLLPEVVPSVSAGEWSFDGTHLFYAKEQHPFPPRHVYRHRLGDDPKQDVLVFEEKDEQWYVSIGKTRSEEYLVISVANFDSSEMHILSARDPLGQFSCVHPRKKKVRYSIEHWGESFYLVTNERAVNYRIDTTPVSEIKRGKWKPFLKHSKSLALTGFAPSAKFFAYTAREKGSEWVYLSEPESAELKRVELPEAAHSISFHDSIPFVAEYARITYSSFLTPKTVFDIDIKTRKLTEKKVQHVPGWQKAKYVSESIFLPSKDGTMIPVSICHKKSVAKNGTAPALVQFYGSYGITYDPFFSIAQLSLMQRGWVIAIVHARGGGEMGWDWHEKVKVLTKHKTYEDIVACVNGLIKKKYMDRKKTAITGGSAGGMTLGAVLNIDPSLCGAAIAYVPNADTVSSMLDTSLGGTRLHYDEIGDPRIKKVYQYLLKWSPYENVKKAAYPALLVRASQHDIRTPFWEAAKWVAKLRATALPKNPLLLRVEMSAGHAGKSGRYEWIKERSSDYAWLLEFVKGIK